MESESPSLRPGPPRVVALLNQKGGVGKTTTSINIACGWARLAGPDRVLLVDIDPQANATAVLLGLEVAAGPRRTDRPTMREVLREEAPAATALQAVPLAPGNGREASPGQGATVLHILPAHLELATIEVELASTFRGEYRLKKALADLAPGYEVVIIDCPPSLGILTLNALICATEVVIPVDPGVFPLIGLNLLNSTIEQVREANPALHISGVLHTMSMNTVMSRETAEELVAVYGDLVLPAVPRRVAIEESHVQGQDVYSAAPRSDGAAAYGAVVEELRRRV